LGNGFGHARASLAGNEVNQAKSRCSMKLNRIVKSSVVRLAINLTPTDMHLDARVADLNVSGCGKHDLRSRRMPLRPGYADMTNA
jgi:hypothetical protein